MTIWSPAAAICFTREGLAWAHRPVIPNVAWMCSAARISSIRVVCPASEPASKVKATTRSDVSPLVITTAEAVTLVVGDVDDVVEVVGAGVDVAGGATVEVVAAGKVTVVTVAVELAAAVVDSVLAVDAVVAGDALVRVGARAAPQEATSAMATAATAIAIRGASPPVVTGAGFRRLRGGRRAGGGCGARRVPVCQT